MTATAILAGGCFWGMEDLIRRLPGVLDTDVGYTGGTLDHPTYHEVTTGKTGHAEALRIVYDPARLRYEDILKVFFQIHDPTTLNRQGNDRGSQYRSAIFYANDSERETAHRLIAAINASGKWPAPVVTEVAPAGPFYIAEDYHQDYLERLPHGYTCHYVRPEWVLEAVDA